MFSYRGVLRDRAPRHPDIDEPPVLMPDRIDARAMPRYIRVGTIAEEVESAAPQRRQGIIQNLHVPAFDGVVRSSLKEIGPAFVHSAKIVAMLSLGMPLARDCAESQWTI